MKRTVLAVLFLGATTGMVAGQTAGMGTGQGSGMGTGQGSGMGTGHSSGMGTGQGSGMGTRQGSGMGTGQSSGMGTGATSGQAPTRVITDADTGTTKEVVNSDQLSRQFEVEREIIDRVKAKYGKTAVYANGHNLPPKIEQALVAGNTMPDGAHVKDVPAKLGELPTTGQGTHWVAVGENLVELAPDNRIVMVVYDALP